LQGISQCCAFVYNRLSAAESLPVEDNSVTLIQVATALHWFDLDKFYRECDRVLVPGGVVAAFCYAFKDFPIVNHPHGDEIHKVLTKVKQLQQFSSYYEK